MAGKRRRSGRRTDDPQTVFALRLAKHLTGAAAASNLVFSPLSIYAALGLAAAGAGGRTLKEILKALGVRSCSKLNELLGEAAEQALADQLQSSGGTNIAFACGVWHDEGWALLPEFQEAADASYKAEVRAVDFRNKPEDAIGDINSWVAAATNNLVNSIVGPSSISWDTSLLLANAIYFKGNWDVPFPKEQTTVEKFFRLDGSTTDAPFMGSARRHLISVHDGSPSELVGGILQPKKYSMCIFLPDVRDGLPELTDRITSSSGFPGDYLPDKPVLVEKFRLPKFKLSSSGGIRQALTDCLGIKNAFDAGEADFSNLANGEGSDMKLFMTEVAHKAMLEVNEKGASRATAATTFGMRILASRIPAKDVDFVADHPFMFFVIEEVSGAIILAGHVLDPST
ncbi:hypothetical protein QOZ80_8BG0660050 [Eleusine coracana subsp. coracana]|nr:hypothetical protein QOZ80_8BG0660050 [Eleusine coracana subsp. coracana]